MWGRSRWRGRVCKLRRSRPPSEHREVPVDAVVLGACSSTRWTLLRRGPHCFALDLVGFLLDGLVELLGDVSRVLRGAALERNIMVKGEARHWCEGRLDSRRGHLEDFLLVGQQVAFLEIVRCATVVRCEAPDVDEARHPTVACLRCSGRGSCLGRRAARTPRAPSGWQRWRPVPSAAALLLFQLMHALLDLVEAVVVRVQARVDAADVLLHGHALGPQGGFEERQQSLLIHTAAAIPRRNNQQQQRRRGGESVRGLGGKASGSGGRTPGPPGYARPAAAP